MSVDRDLLGPNMENNFWPLLVESSVIVIFYVIFLMRYAVIINY